MLFFLLQKLTPGDKMKSNKEILSSLLKTTQMGQIGIRSVQDSASNEDLKKALSDQLREYDSIEKEVHALAQHRGWQLHELNPSIRAMSEMMSMMKLMGGNKDSKIAAMMIQGNTRGMITGLKNAHLHSEKDEKVTALSDKLLSFETANIQQMAPFL